MVPECIMTVGMDGSLVSMNLAGLRMAGAESPESLTGKNISSIIAPDHLDRFRAAHERICSDDSCTVEVEIVFRTGQRSLTEGRSGALTQPNGSSVPISIFRGVEGRRQAGRDARLLSAIVDSSDDAIISKNLDGIITSWNQGAERVFGYTAAEIIGQPITILIPPEHVDEEPRILARLRRGERVEHFETVRKRKDGRLIDISLTVSPVKDENGTIIGASKIARDISERKRMEDEVRRINHDLEQFAFTVSHDLREPVRHMKVYSELLTRRSADSLDSEALQFLQFIDTGATRLEALVKGLLQYTQIARLEHPSRPVDANLVLSQTLETLSEKIQQSGARISSGSLPTLLAHETHLQQLFENLITNAIQFRSPDRAPLIIVDAARRLDYWEFSVSDNGIGIDASYTDRIFGLFKRLDKRSEGTGIGLAICQRIVSRYFGVIWVDSEPGRGSTFRFTLPSS